MHSANIDMDRNRIVTIQYTNYKGAMRNYRIIPHAITFGRNEFHPVEQWLLSATDVDRNVLRSFAMNRIETWTAKSDQ